MMAKEHTSHLPRLLLDGGKCGTSRTIKLFLKDCKSGTSQTEWMTEVFRLKWVNQPKILANNGQSCMLTPYQKNSSKESCTQTLAF
jgi:hypothetical protein